MLGRPWAKGWDSGGRPHQTFWRHLENLPGRTGYIKRNLTDSSNSILTYVELGIYHLGISNIYIYVYMYMYMYYVYVGYSYINVGYI